MFLVHVYSLIFNHAFDCSYFISSLKVTWLCKTKEGRATMRVGMFLHDKCFTWKDFEDNLVVIYNFKTATKIL